MTCAGKDKGAGEPYPDWHQTTIYAMGWNLLHIRDRVTGVVTFAKHNAQ